MRRIAKKFRARLFGVRLIGAAAAFAFAAGCSEGAREAQNEAGAAGEEIVAISPSDAFLAMADNHASAVLKEAPEFASILGVSEDIAGEGYSTRLGGYGFEANQRARELNESFLQELKSYTRSELNEKAALTYDILRNAYETGAQRNQFQFGGASAYGSSSPYALTQLSGPHLFLPRLLQTQQPLNSADDVEAYLSRLGEFGRAFDEVIENFGGDAALGIVPPYFALEGAARSMRGFSSPAPAENPLVTTLASKMEAIEGLSDDQRADFMARAIELVGSTVYPAYARLATALEEQVQNAGRDAGVWRLGEEGEAFYQLALNSYGAGGLTGEEIHELGLSEVGRITDEMDTILRDAGMTDGSVAARFEAIGARAELRYPNTDEGRAELLGDLNIQVAQIMEKAPEWFATTPEQGVEIRRIPIYEQDTAPGGYYNSPSLDGTRPGIYWINLKNTADWPKHTLKTLTYHEAVPGHHFQRSLERAAGLPLLRNMLGYSEFAEGWALYAEKVASEMGMYENDPFGDLARLQSELFRAARLVVDSGLHHKRWSREEAIAYMVATTGDTEASITREIERYSVWPGQACAYKLGMIKMEALRARAEGELGAGFDIRAFHDEILLSGAMPLPVLEAKIDRWIAVQKSK